MPAVAGSYFSYCQLHRYYSPVIVSPHLTNLTYLLFGSTPLSQEENLLLRVGVFKLN